MDQDKEWRNDRRKVLKVIGRGAVVLPFAALGACSSEEPTPAAPKPAVTEPPAAAKPAAPEKPAPAPEPARETAPPAAPARIAEDDRQAVSLGYVHDAAEVDANKYTQFADGQACSNCALFQAAGDDGWGGCSIFPGKQVKATGWCSVYAAK